MPDRTIVRGDELGYSMQAVTVRTAVAGWFDGGGSAMERFGILGSQEVSATQLRRELMRTIDEMEGKAEPGPAVRRDLPLLKLALAWVDGRLLVTRRRVQLRKAILAAAEAGVIVVEEVGAMADQLLEISRNRRALHGPED